MSNRTGGYYRKNGTWVSPDGYGRKRGRGGNNGGDFYSYIIVAFIVIFFWIISKCSN